MKKFAYRLGSENNGSNCPLRCGIAENRELKEISFSTPQYAMVFVIEGSGIYTIHGKEYIFRPGDIFQRFPGEKHKISFSTVSRHAFIAVPSGLFQMLKEVTGGKFIRPVLRPTLRNIPELFSGIIDELNFRRENELPRIMNKMNGVITEILLSCRNISVEYGKKDSFTEKAALKLTEKLAEKISLPNLAAEFNMSYSKFRREFKKRSGEAPGSYRKRKRFEKAQIILAENNLTIGQIAEKLGYVDIYTFSKHFKKYFGISPTEFRKGKVY